MPDNSRVPVFEERAKKGRAGVSRTGQSGINKASAIRYLSRGETTK